MKQIYFSLILFLLGGYVVPVYSQVFQITERNFDKLVKDKDVMLIAFYMPWCKHCQALQPEWDTSEKVLEQNREFILGRVNCWEDGKTLCDKLDIQMYPDIRLYRHGKYIESYEGERNAAGILDFVQRAQATTGRVGSVPFWEKNNAQAANPPAGQVPLAAQPAPPPPAMPSAAAAPPNNGVPPVAAPPPSKGVPPAAGFASAPVPIPPSLPAMQAPRPPPPSVPNPVVNSPLAPRPAVPPPPLPPPVLPPPVLPPQPLPQQQVYQPPPTSHMLYPDTGHVPAAQAVPGGMVEMPGTQAGIDMLPNIENGLYLLPYPDLKGSLLSTRPPGIKQERWGLFPASKDQTTKEELLQQSVELQKKLLEEEKSRHDLLQLLIQQQQKQQQLELQLQQHGMVQIPARAPNLISDSQSSSYFPISMLPPDIGAFFQSDKENYRKAYKGAPQSKAPNTGTVRKAGSIIKEPAVLQSLSKERKEAIRKTFSNPLPKTVLAIFKQYIGRKNPSHLEKIRFSRLLSQFSANKSKVVNAHGAHLRNSPIHPKIRSLLHRTLWLRMHGERQPQALYKLPNEEIDAIRMTFSNPLPRETVNRFNQLLASHHTAQDKLQAAREQVQALYPGIPRDVPDKKISSRNTTAQVQKKSEPNVSPKSEPTELKPAEKPNTNGKLLSSRNKETVETPSSHSLEDVKHPLGVIIPSSGKKDILGPSSKSKLNITSPSNPSLNKTFNNLVNTKNVVPLSVGVANAKPDLRRVPDVKRPVTAVKNENPTLKHFISARPQFNHFTDVKAELSRGVSPLLRRFTVIKPQPIDPISYFPGRSEKKSDLRVSKSQWSSYLNKVRQVKYHGRSTVALPNSLNTYRYKHDKIPRPPVATILNYMKQAKANTFTRRSPAPEVPFGHEIHFLKPPVVRMNRVQLGNRIHAAKPPAARSFLGNTPQSKYILGFNSAVNSAVNSANKFRNRLVDKLKKRPSTNGKDSVNKPKIKEDVESTFGKSWRANQYKEYTLSLLDKKHKSTASYAKAVIENNRKRIDAFHQNYIPLIENNRKRFDAFHQNYMPLIGFMRSNIRNNTPLKRKAPVLPWDKRSFIFRPQQYHSVVRKDNIPHVRRKYLSNDDILLQRQNRLSIALRQMKKRHVGIGDALRQMKKRHVRIEDEEGNKRSDISDDALWDATKNCVHGNNSQRRQYITPYHCGLHFPGKAHNEMKYKRKIVISNFIDTVLVRGNHTVMNMTSKRVLVPNYNSHINKMLSAMVAKHNESERKSIITNFMDTVLVRRNVTSSIRALHTARGKEASGNTTVTSKRQFLQGNNNTSSRMVNRPSILSNNIKQYLYTVKNLQVQDIAKRNKTLYGIYHKPPQTIKNKTLSSGNGTRNAKVSTIKNKTLSSGNGTRNAKVSKVKKKRKGQKKTSKKYVEHRNDISQKHNDGQLKFQSPCTEDLNLVPHTNIFNDVDMGQQVENIWNSESITRSLEDDNNTTTATEVGLRFSL